MVAAMHIQNENDRTAFGLRTTELRNVAIGFAVAIALIMVAGQISDSGSASGSALDDTNEKRFITINSGQTANVAENTAANGAVLTVAITDGPATACFITAGNTDGSDADTDGPFQISTTCVITVDDSDELDYETTTTYTLTLLANDADSSDVETVAITVTDVNDQTPAVNVAATYNHAEAAATTFQTYTMVDTDTSGYYDCTIAGTDAADFSKSVSGKVCTVTWAANPDYDSPADNGGNNVYDITIAFTDGTNALGAQTTAITVTAVQIAITASQTASIAESASSGASVMTVATTGDTDDNDFAIASGNTGTAFAINAASGAITTAAALDYDTTTSYTLGITVTDGDASDSENVVITITDANDQTPAVTVQATYSPVSYTHLTLPTILLV